MGNVPKQSDNRACIIPGCRDDRACTLPSHSDRRAYIVISSSDNLGDICVRDSSPEGIMLGGFCEAGHIGLGKNDSGRRNGAIEGGKTNEEIGTDAWTVVAYVANMGNYFLLIVTVARQMPRGTESNPLTVRGRMDKDGGTDTYR